MNHSHFYPQRTDAAEASEPRQKLLELTKEHRFATTHQLARFLRPSYRSERSALRQTLRHLAALQQDGLVSSLERRVGGWQGGSSVGIWTLTSRGHRHLTGSRKRLRPHHLSTHFLEHSLAVTETCVRLQEATRQLADYEVVVQQEPACWRSYLGSHGERVTLRPDLYAQVSSTDYEDRYFLEVDRSSENPGRVIRKCWQYEHHRRSGAEQKRAGVYPAVVWLVPSEHRKQQLLRHLTQEPKLPQHLFVVITPDELTALIRDGPPSAAN